MKEFSEFLSNDIFAQSIFYMGCVTGILIGFAIRSFTNIFIGLIDHLITKHFK